MQITINIDCTPVEARQLAGLPDVQPMQQRLMGELEQRFRDGIDSLTPDAMLQRWFGILPTGIEQMKALMEQFLNRDRGASHDATPPTPPGIRVRTTAVRRIKHPWVPGFRVRASPWPLRPLARPDAGLHPCQVSASPA